MNPGLAEQAAAWRRDGKTIALANGLFDILHVGHLRYLEAAALEADILVVAVNSDRSARELKGAGRPLVPERERVELLAGFRCVDHAVVFDGATVGEVLEALRPDVHCKGTDYSPKTVPERGVAERLGIRIAIVGDTKRHATRDMVARIRGDQS
ncbi:MAG: adenylyltransferase/cytidyltransferase family protein [Acidobacteria bacterium]|uniref:Adenylyltransferase/cytidyltransferase family protein n=1 Tax=Candidatus Polarisedimenticola svalbardensis TaxID=2886004 RepID=A0A8J6Y7W8_9BACT|nr:adenylyltransferase/cytidyltransferase family protein [Candidatus Polarisedimenticola svalbardensis]